MRPELTQRERDAAAALAAAIDAPAPEFYDRLFDLLLANAAGARPGQTPTDPFSPAASPSVHAHLAMQPRDAHDSG